MRISSIIRGIFTISVLSAALLSLHSCQKHEDEAGISAVPVKFETAITRAAELTTETINSFRVSAFLDDEDSTPFMNETEVSRTAGIWTYGPVKYWPVQGKVNFFAYSSSAGDELKDFVFEKTEGGKFQARFEYSLPSPDESGQRDAESQPDLVFAQQAGLTEADGKVKFNFSHALTAIQFKVGKVPANTTLERIDFVNVHGQGTCVVTGGSDNKLTFDWSPDELNHRIYSQKFPSLHLSEGTVVSTKSEATTFMMIPQAFDEHARIRFVFKIDGEEYIKDVLYLKDIHPSWKPGEIHTYTITLN